MELQRTRDKGGEREVGKGREREGSKKNKMVWAVHSKPGNAVFSKSPVELFGRKGTHATTQTTIGTNLPRHK